MGHPGFRGGVMPRFPGSFNPAFNRGFFTPGFNRGFITPGFNGMSFTPGFNRGFVTPGFNGGFVTPGLSRGFFTPGFNPGFDRRLDRFEDRFNRGFFFDPRFGTGTFRPF
jgi:hypothetical protein